MSKQDIAEKIKQFIASNFYVADQASLTPAASFYEQGIVDSTGVLEVVSFLEGTFGITIQDSEMLPENLDSLQALNDFVERKLSAAAPRPAPEEAPSVSHTPQTASVLDGVSSAPPMLARGRDDPA